MTRATAPWLVTALLLFGAELSLGCRSLLGIRSASGAERAKVTQLVGPLEQRAVPLQSALQAVVDSATTPVRIDVCSSLLDAPVTIVTVWPVQLGSVVLAAGMQLGAPVRLFVGEHGEIARPSLFCPDRKGTLQSIERRPSASVP